MDEANLQSNDGSAGGARRIGFIVALSVLGIVGVLAILVAVGIAMGMVSIGFSPFYANVYTPLGSFYATSVDFEFFKAPRHERAADIVELEALVNEFVASTADDKIMALTVERTKLMFNVFPRPGGLVIGFHTDPESNPCAEDSVRAFFAERGDAPIADTPFGGGSSSRFIEYQLGPSTEEAGATILRLTQEVCGIDAETRVDVYLQP